MFLGIFRGSLPSENSEEYSLGKFRGTISSEFSEGISLGIFRGRVPRNFPTVFSEGHSLGKFRGIFRQWDHRRCSSEFPRKKSPSEFRHKFPREFRRLTLFRRYYSDGSFPGFVVGIREFRRHSEDIFPGNRAVFL